MISPEAILMVFLAAAAVFIAFTRLSCGQSDDPVVAWLPDLYDELAPEEPQRQAIRR